MSVLLIRKLSKLSSSVNSGIETLGVCLGCDFFEGCFEGDKALAEGKEPSVVFLFGEAFAVLSRIGDFFRRGSFIVLNGADEIFLSATSFVLDVFGRPK